MSNDLVQRSSTAIAVPDDVADRFPSLSEESREILQELMEENFGSGETMSVTDLTIVKVPSGSGAAMFTFNADGEDQAVKELKGVIVGWRDRRNYWEQDLEESGGGEAPDCSSRDGKIGLGLYGLGSEGNPSGLCESCPMAQWGGDKDNRVPPQCKQQAVIMLMVEGELFPYLINVPRTSLKPFKIYRTSLLKQRLGVAQVVTTLSLEKVKGNGTPDYYTIKFAKGDDLGRGVKKAALEFGQNMLPILDQVVDRSDNTAETNGRPTASSGAVSFGDDEEYDGS